MMKFLTIVVLIVLTCIGLASDSFAAGKNLTLDDYLYAKRLFDEGYFDLAAEQLERVLQNYPEFPDADEAHYLLADAYFKNEQYKKARATYLRLAIVFPESPHAAESMFNVAVVLELMEKPQKAAHAYGRVHGFYPQSVFALKGLGEALRLYEADHDTTKAETVSDLILEKFPTSTIADQVQLRKAMWLLARQKTAKAKSLLIRLSAQTTIDSLSASALLELGRIYRSELNWDKANSTWSKAVYKDPHCDASFRAVLEIADLYIYQGLTSKAIEFLTVHSDKYKSATKISQSQMKIGDAFYRQGDYAEAHSYYQKIAKTNIEARLKSAWTAEMMGEQKIALQEYIDIDVISQKSNIAIHIRMAILSTMTNQAGLARRYWSRVIADTSLIDSLGSYYWKYAQLLSNEAGELILLDSLANHLITKYPLSPYADDIAYKTAHGYEQDKQYDEAIKRYQALIENYPASEFNERAFDAIRYIQNTKIRSPQLVEKMAELSSSFQSSANPVKFATSWGDFYLDDFKNPVKAIDHYDQVIQDVLGSTEQRAYCLYKTGIAYLNLCQAAMLESDAVSVEMYCDSSIARLNDLEKLAPLSNNVILLRNAVIYNQYKLANNDKVRLKAAFELTSQAIGNMGVVNIQPRVFIKYFQTALILESIDSTNYSDWLAEADMVESLSELDSEIAELKFLQLNIISEIDSAKVVIDSANIILTQWQETPAAAKTTEWLIESEKVSAAEKLDLLQFYKHTYPYRIDPEMYAWYTANAYDSLGNHFESILWREIQDQLSQRGKPDLDILNVPDADTHYRKGMAYYLTGDFERCVNEFQSYLNLDPLGDYAAEVILTFAWINVYANNHSAAITYLDTLIERFPFSTQVETEAVLRPRLEFAVENYSTAFGLFQSLKGKQSDPDSSFEYEKMSIVCKYRLNELDNARKRAKALYKEFGQRENIESVKALFYLEKGRSLQSSGNYIEARKNYKVVSDKYPLSEWMDDAQFEIAMSFLKERNWKDGIEKLDNFVENYPESEYIPQGILTLGVTRLSEEKYSEALKYLKNAWLNSSSEPIRLQAFNHLITAYRDLRFWDAAIHVSREYLEEYPDADDAFIRKMDIGQFYIQIGEYEEAIRHYRPMLEYADAESEAEIQFYIGESYQKNGDYQSAILEYMKVRILGRKTKLDWGITALYQSGNCYELLGDNKGAAVVYKRIIKDTGATSNYGRTAQKRMDGLTLSDGDRE